MAAQGAAWSAAEQAARGSYGRLVAWLSYRWGDIEAAEDALSDALLAALTHWPTTGIPDAPDAWLMTVAKRNLQQRWRHQQVERAPEMLALLADTPTQPDQAAIPDARLKLLLICAHPAVPSKLHAPLMLQVVLGIEAKTVANAFLLSPAAMAQRLVRAKSLIRESGLRYEEPETNDMPQRLAPVLEAIYGAYAIGSNVAATGPLDGQPGLISELTGEATYLARLVTELQPDSAEAVGLLALILYCEARRPAQFDEAGRFVTLTEQDLRRWDRALLAEAEHCLWRASALKRAGRFQLEAAIQSAHCQRAYDGNTPWSAIAELYCALLELAPGVGAQIGYAVAKAECGEVAAGLDLLEALPAKEIVNYQPYWVALAHLQRKAGQLAAAEGSLERALGLTADGRVREYLRRGGLT